MTTVKSIARKVLMVLSLLSIGGSAAYAETYPSNVIRIVVPTGPGTPPDVISRVIATELSEAEGWRMIVENKPGALQTIGITEVLHECPDGRSACPDAESRTTPGRGFHADHQAVEIL